MVLMLKYNSRNRPVNLCGNSIIKVFDYFCRKHDIQEGIYPKYNYPSDSTSKYLQGISEFIKLHAPENKCKGPADMIAYFLQICFVLEAADRGLDAYKDFDAIVEHVENLINS